MRSLICLFLLILVSTGPLSARRPPIDHMKGPHKRRIEEPKPQSGILYLYQKYISPIDGDRCPMHPGCSSFMAEAVEKRGLLMGVIMGSDRLQRCGRKLYSYPWIIRNNQFYAYDPLEEK